MAVCGGLVVARAVRPLAGVGRARGVGPARAAAGRAAAARAAPARVGRRGGARSLDGLSTIATAGGGRLFGEPWALAAGLLALGVAWMLGRAAHHARHAAAVRRAARAARAADHRGALREHAAQQRLARRGAARRAGAVDVARAARRWRCRAPSLVSLVAVGGRAGVRAAGALAALRRLAAAGPVLAPGLRTDLRPAARPPHGRDDARDHLRRAAAVADARARGLGPRAAGTSRTTRSSCPSPRPSGSPPRSRSSGCATARSPPPGASSTSTATARPAAARAGASTRRRTTASPTRSPARSCAPPPRSWRRSRSRARGAFDHVTQLWPRRFYRSGDRLPEWIDHSPWGEALRLSQQLAAGTDSQLEVVRRVEDYLTSGRFRYTTDVDEPGEDPLLEFLFETHAGYCQHFAGAAALLLRLAGVPTRVVTGFATGKRTGDETYIVRDKDAHAWIEVYFPGFGWVPFNPTPAAARGGGLRRARRVRGRGQRRRRRRAGRRSRWSAGSARWLAAGVHARPPAPPPGGRARRGARAAGRAGRAVGDAAGRCGRGWPRSGRRSPRWPTTRSGRASRPTARASLRARGCASGGRWCAISGGRGRRGCSYVSGSSTVRRMCS